MAFRRIVRALTILGAITPALQGQVSTEWLAFHGPVAGQYDQARHATADAAGNVCVTFLTGDTMGDTDVDIAKYSATGTLLWTRRFDSGIGANDTPVGIAIAPNGDVWACVDQQAPWEVILLRYDSSGNLLSTIPSGIAGDDRASSFAMDAQGNMYIAGKAPGGQFYDMLIRAYSGTGSLLWDKRIDGPMGLRDEVKAMIIDSAGSIFVAGSIENPTRDAAVVKLSAGGAVQWLKTVSQPYGDVFLNLASDRQGGVVACGSTEISQSFQTYQWGLVSRFDAAGSVLWSDPYPTGLLASFTTDVFMDDGGTTWALHAKDQFGIARAHVSRISPSGVRLSAQDVPSADSPAGLVPGNAGQVFVGGTANAFGPWASHHGVLCQFDASGGLSWAHDLALGASGVLPFGIQEAPRNRLIAFGKASFGPSYTDVEGLVMQVDVSESPHGYCTGKVNSLGCAPRTIFVGMPSASANSGFEVHVEQVLNQKSGLFLYGVNGSASTPFGGGALCVASPVRRTIGVHSGGGPGPAMDCSGIYAINMNAFAQGGLGGTPAPELSIPGTQVWMQAWGRDNGFPAPNNLSLSGGLTYVIFP